MRCSDVTPTCCRRGTTINAEPATKIPPQSVPKKLKAAEPERKMLDRVW